MSTCAAGSIAKSDLRTATVFRPLWRGQSPFRGLQPFEAEHQAIYFGRSEALGDLLRQIRETEAAADGEEKIRVLLVQGMSGAGKTSLFKAGLLPLLDLRPSRALRMDHGVAAALGVRSLPCASWARSASSHHA